MSYVVRRTTIASDFEMEVFGFSFSFLDISGVVLAVIGYFNLSEPLERWFRWVRIYGRGARNHAIRKIKNHWPPHDYWKFWGRQSVVAAIESIIVILFLHWVAQDGLPWLTPIFTLPVWIIALLSIGGFIVLSIAMFAFDLVWLSFVTIIGNLFWRLFKLMAAAPAGVVGTIGLAVTLGSLVLG